MAKFTPLIGSITGKIGGMVIGRNRTVRLFVKAANRTPHAFKTIFAQLAAAWPFGEVEAKSLIMKSPGVANGVKIVTRSSGVLYNLIPDTPSSAGTSTIVNNAKYGPMPDRLLDLPGEFAELVQRGLLSYSALVSDTRALLTTPVETIASAYFENPRVCSVLLKLDDINHGAPAPMRALALADMTLNGPIWQFEVASLTADTKYLVVFSTLATIISTGQPIMLGHTAAYVHTAPVFTP